MITNQKGLFIAFAIFVVSCTESIDPDLNDNSVDTLMDSIVNTSEKEMIDTLNSDTSAAWIDRDLNCEAHFQAAMNLPKPERIIIVHCDYWSSDHPILREHSYGFELEADDVFFNELIEHNGMVEYNNKRAIVSQQEGWFLPNNADNYEGFYAEDDFDDFEIFRDLKSGHIFIRGSQY